MHVVADQVFDDDLMYPRGYILLSCFLQRVASLLDYVNIAGGIGLFGPLCFSERKCWRIN